MLSKWWISLLKRLEALNGLLKCYYGNGLEAHPLERWRGHYSLHTNWILKGAHGTHIWWKRAAMNKECAPWKASPARSAPPMIWTGTLSHLYGYISRDMIVSNWVWFQSWGVVTQHKTMSTDILPCIMPWGFLMLTMHFLFYSKMLSSLADNF